MKKPPNFLKAIPLAMVVCSSILVSTAEPASAFGWPKRDELGIATTRDNRNYWRSKGRVVMPNPPNRNDICRWKYPRDNGTVYGKAVSWSNQMETKCYHRYWKWWW